MEGNKVACISILSFIHNELNTYVRYFFGQTPVLTDSDDSGDSSLNSHSALPRKADDECKTREDFT